MSVCVCVCPIDLEWIIRRCVQQLAIYIYHALDVGYYLWLNEYTMCEVYIDI